MDYIDSVKRAINFIEKNLKEPIRLPDIAREACFSMYHFHRIFQALTGESAAAYIRKRRLTAAAHELLSGGLSPLDLAIDYQFESQAAFTRAFKRQFRETPARYRRRGVGGTIFEKAPLRPDSLVHLNSGISLTPQIVLESERLLLGLSTLTSLENNRVFALWDRFTETISQIKGAVEPAVKYGVHDSQEEGSITIFNSESELSYLAAIEVESFEGQPLEMEQRVVKKQLYARFTHRGSLDRLLDSYAFIYGSWLPRAPYELACACDFERFDNRFSGAAEAESELDIYIAIK